jgi:hypothetical protein
MHNERRHLRRKSWTVLVWALALFLAGNAVLGVLLVRHDPDFCDAEYQLRFRSLRARLAEAPGRPLALILGSSRPANGLRPASIAAGAALADPQPIVFNYSLLGAGPIRQLVVLRRLLASGIKPRWVFVEVWAPLLMQLGLWTEENALKQRVDLYWTDVPILSRLYHQYDWPIRNVVARTAAPAVHCRTWLIKRYAPFLVPRTSADDMKKFDVPWRTLDGDGWLSFPFKRCDEEAFRRRAEEEEKARMKPILDSFAVGPVSDRALRELLDLCRRQGIGTALYLMPEHSILRNWYPEATQTRLADYLHQLSVAYETPVFDLRARWPDSDFGDITHLLPEGASAFSERFGREVYRPVLEGCR